MYVLSVYRTIFISYIYIYSFHLQQKTWFFIPTSWLVLYHIFLDIITRRNTDMALAGLWIELHRGLVAALVMKNHRGQHKNMKNHGAMVFDCWRCNDFKLESWVSVFQNISVWRLTVWNSKGSRTWNKNNPICWSELKLQNPLSFTHKPVIMLHDHRSAHMSWNHLPPQYSDLKLQKSETAKEFFQTRNYSMPAELLSKPGTFAPRWQELLANVESKRLLTKVRWLTWWLWFRYSLNSNHKCRCLLFFEYHNKS